MFTTELHHGSPILDKWSKRQNLEAWYSGRHVQTSPISDLLGQTNTKCRKYWTWIDGSVTLTIRMSVSKSVSFSQSVPSFRHCE